MSDVTLRLLVLLTAFVQIAFPFFVNPFRGGAQPVRVSAASQIEPAGYAFAIWGPIYLAALAYAAWQLTASGRSDPVTARIAPLAIVLYAGSSLWLACVQYGPHWASMPILAAMAFCAAAALVLASWSGNGTLLRYLCLVLPFALYAGWTLCATFVNVAEVAPAYGFARFGLSVPSYAVLSILAATLLAGGILWLTRGNMVFAATVAWALAAIIVAALQRGHDAAVVAAAGAALAAVAALSVAIKVLDARGIPVQTPPVEGAARW